MKKKFQKTVLSLPNDLYYLPLMMSYVEQAALLAGFAEFDVNKLQLAVEEGVAALVAPGISEGEEAEFQLIAEKVPLGMRFILKDKGLPYETGAIPVYNQAEMMEDELSEEAVTALSIHMMEQVADKLEFFNLGREGKETHITKYLPALSVEECETESRAEAGLSPEEPQLELPPYQIRYLEPQEAIEISRLAYFTYGYTYKSYIYYPEQVRELNALGKVASLVAASAKGEVMGHASLNFTEEDRLVAELGTGFVKNCYRGQGLLKELMLSMIEEARRRALTGFFGQPVTSHFYSQKACVNLAMQPTALFLARVSAVKFKDIKPDNQQRESFFHYFRYLKGEQAEARLYLPKQHEAMLKKIYDNLAVKRDFGVAKEAALPQEHTVTSVKRDAAFLTATISVKRHGYDSLREVKRVLRELKQEELKGVVLELNLAQPQTALLLEHFEQLGFIFAGILPQGNGEDILCLQYVSDCRVDFAQVKVYGEKAQEIAAYVQHYYEME